MPNPWTSEYDDDDWESLLAQLIIGGASLYHPTSEVAEAAWAPTDVNGLVLWLKADQISGLSDSDPLGTWEDQSGSNNNATQSTGSKKPLYRDTGGQIYVWFDGSDDEMSYAGGIFDEDAMAAWVVWKNDIGQDSMILTAAGQNWFSHAPTFCAFKPSANDAQKAAVNNQWNLLGCTHEGDGGNFYARVNGSPSNASTQSGAMSFQWIYLAHSAIGAVYQGNGSLKEVIIYNRTTGMGALSSDDITNVESYLNTRHSIY